MNSQDKYDLTEGSIIRKLLRFFFPILLGMLFQQLYNTVDAIIVGKFIGPEALAAVGGSPAVIINLVIGFFTGLASGATVIISQHFGSHDGEKLSRAEHTVLLCCLLAGLALSALGWWSAPWSLRLVKTPADILEASTVYLRIYYTGAAALLLFNIGSGILRAVGDSVRPLVFLGICCVLNIALDLLFVAVWHMGVAGVAWATVLSLLVSAALILIHLSRVEGPHRFVLAKLRIDSGALRRILFIGVPAGVQGAMYSLSNIIIQSAVNALGTTIVAAWTAVGKLDGLYWVTSNSFGAALCTFVGQCFGASKLDRMKKGIRVWLWLALGVSVGISVLLIAIAPLGFRLFTDDPAVMREALQMIWYFVPFYFTWTFIEIFSNALRGAGDSVRPMLISLFGVCLLRVAWILVVVPWRHTVLSIALSYPVTWFVTGLVYVIYYLRGNWLRRLLGQQQAA